MSKWTLHKTWRTAKWILGLGAIGALAVALVFQFRVHMANEWQQYEPLPPAPAPRRGDSIIVFAPHSDDETLGCGGMLAMASARGAKVRVVLVTNGDGFRVAVARAFRTIRVTPEQCIEFAYRRQHETLAALAVLGIRASQVTFLGYPDRGIARLWDTNWGPETLYVSHSTGWDHSPYRNSCTLDAPYCGESLLADIMRILKQANPTDVYIPHPCDNHADHYATYCFVTAAVEQLRSEGYAPAGRIRAHTYLVHRGDWPTPKGDHPEERLAPPHALAGGDTRWTSLDLDSRVAEVKQEAIRSYRTQAAVERGFLSSFARRNEVFGDLPVRSVARVARGAIAVDGDTADWWPIPPAVVDPVGDYLVAGINKGGDVRAIYAANDGQFLYVRIDCVRSLSKRITYSLNLRGVDGDRCGDRYVFSIRPGKSCSPPHARWAYHNNVIELSVPRSRLHFDRDLFIQVSTKLMRLTVDNTGWHELKAPG